MNFFERVYEVVRQIPKGKVLTYGLVGKEIGTRDSRRVGHALHANKSSDDVPCHRVIFSDGRLSSGYAFGGEFEQRRRLEAEGVVFCGDRVDLTRSLWKRV